MFPEGGRKILTWALGSSTAGFQSGKKFTAVSKVTVKMLLMNVLFLCLTFTGPQILHRTAIYCSSFELSINNAQPNERKKGLSKMN